ncbi:MAG: flagellar type III secretion system pore protein FliP [Candidatus Eremiobacterota bacterium]
MPSVVGQLTGGQGPEQLSAGLHILLILTLMALAPAILVTTTSFTRILIVLAFTRQAMGTPNIPPNMVLIPLAGFLTLLSMGPVLDQVYADALKPGLEGKLQPIQAYERAAAPLRSFMQRNTRQKDLAMLLQAARLPRPQNLQEVPDRVLVPAFVLSELRAAFTMGFALFLAFMAVDLVVSGILMALGMFMVPPMSISLPIKLLLFVLVDGWSLITRSLLFSFS